ncbi:DUF1496 domain-containing protein [Photobacterium chitinilyticum]|uniref:DUF1496 domain-containing protein n=1 Tax=Photobacterium chitinilyticum TaxID=2485123 RepID=A0A3S3R5X4_9GAMM|nr:DUF1496 domain-containing protein [Photobacterium chitinilyticum]RWX53100.1 DUF1496 domain-containing protein [Photobacterium chitinilyticum]
MKFKGLSKKMPILSLLLVAAAFSVNALAKEITIKHNPDITIQPRSLSNRVCLYDGKDYSLGSILVVENIVLECKAENDFESNGRLKWHKVEKKAP